jgi:hypothetical protein
MTKNMRYIFFVISKHIVVIVSQLKSDRLNFKPRTQVKSIGELDKFLSSQFEKDEVVIKS